MSTTLDHIVRHEFYDLRNMEAAEAFMKSKIAQLRSYLRINDEIVPSIIDYSEFTPEEVEQLKGALVDLSERIRRCADAL